MKSHSIKNMTEELSNQEKEELKSLAEDFQKEYMALCGKHKFHHQAALQSTQNAIFAALIVAKTLESKEEVK